MGEIIYKKTLSLLLLFHATIVKSCKCDVKEFTGNKHVVSKRYKKKFLAKTRNYRLVVFS